ncbi:MAG: hypothetical protein HY286_02245 [Planctomycetes bacterium]|nr:hypothetical protein [Planctomycetota bacterium]
MGIFIIISSCHPGSTAVQDSFLQKAGARVAEMQQMIGGLNAFAEEATKDIDDAEPANLDVIRKSDSVPAKFTYFFNCKEVPRPWVLAVQEDGFKTSESIAASFGEMLDAARGSLDRRYSPYISLRDWGDSPVAICIFRSKAQYERWRRCGNLKNPSAETAEEFCNGVGGVRKPGMLYSWLRDSHEEKLGFNNDAIAYVMNSVWHETAHEWLELNSARPGYGDGSMPWLVEGFAEYVCAHSSLPGEAGRDHYFFGLPNSRRKVDIYKFGKFSEKIEAGALVDATPSLKESVHCDYNQLNVAYRALDPHADYWNREQLIPDKHPNKSESTVRGVYAYGWALCHFLQHAQNGRYRDRFHQLLTLEFNKQSNGAAFDKLFGLAPDEAWARFETEFQDYLFLTIRRDFIDMRGDKTQEKYLKEFELMSRVK